MKRRARHTHALAVAAATLALAGTAFAQGTGTVHLFIDPAGHEYILDHSFRMRQPQLELAPGKHHFSFWAPLRTVVDTNLVVEEGGVTNLTLRLPFSRDYLVYQRDLRQYKTGKKVARIVPSVITGGAILSTVLSYAKMKKAHDQLERDRKEYDELGSPYRISVLKEQTMPEHKEAFRKAQVQLGVSAGITLLSAGVTAYVFHKTGKAQRPEFIDREKLRFDGLGWMPGPHGGQLTGGLTWNFAR